MAVPADYLERAYAGVLGKMIGVYLGRPFEGWTHEHILAELGEIDGYVHERLGKPLVVTDDDLSGTFAFARALDDHGCSRTLSSAAIGDAWLNYIIEGRTILWWGGMGHSSEHTAYLRLLAGVDAPRSGSIGANGRIVAEQIGAQIFIDGWAMMAPGDPELAAELAMRAAAVSHDGEAIHGARVIAAMEALAFVESDLGRLLDEALRFIPADSTIARMIGELREIRAAEGDWRAGFRRFRLRYNYERFPGNCHIVPNHGVIILGLLYGGGDFARTLSIVNTCGWDTDCNSGNAGCLLGIRNGTAGIDGGGHDWRGPVADRLYVTTADGGRTVSDAVTEACRLVACGHALAGARWAPPKGGDRFHFDLPGSVQGFRADPDCEPALSVVNVAGHSRLGERSLRLSWAQAVSEARAGTAVFVPPEDFVMPGYGLQACPALYPGQVLAAEVEAATAVRAALYVKAHGRAAPALYRGPAVDLRPGGRARLEWRVPDTGSAPIYEAGVEVSAAAAGALHLDSLGWQGEPETLLGPQSDGGGAWRRAWADAMSSFAEGRRLPLRATQNHGTGLLIQGGHDWRDVEASVEVAITMARSAGLAVRVRGLRRYCALLLCSDGSARLVRVFDRERRTLAEAPFTWIEASAHTLRLAARGDALLGSIDGRIALEASIGGEPAGGAIALLCEEGTMEASAVAVRPAAGEDLGAAP